MANQRLTFTLDGNDRLSRVLDQAGDAATRMSRRILVASINSDAAVRRFANNSVRSMADLDHSSHDSAKAMETLRKAAVGLAPAALPIAASLAPIAATAGAAGLAVAAFGAALGGQIGPLGEAVDAEEKYNDAVAQHGARSKEAAQAQAEYLRQVQKLPPATRQAAASLSVLKDQYKAWSDSLAGDTMAPLTKSFAVLGTLLPRLTPTVQGAAHELDRLVNIAGGAVASPGFTAFTDRLSGVTTGAIKRANDALIHLMLTADTGQVGAGISQFLDYARAQGPVVADTLKNLGTALLNVLNGTSGVGVSMLTVVNAISKLIAAVPPGAIATVLQLSLAIKAVQLASVGLAAGRAALAAFSTQILAMRTAAAAAPGPLAAAGAAITALSRTAKLAIAGTGLGLLVIALSELSANSAEAPPDVDKLTVALKELGSTGKVTGTALSEFGKGFGELSKLIGEVVNPSVVESINNWGADITGGFLDAGAATEEFNTKVDSIDQSLASLVSSGNADLAAAALRNMLKTMDPERADKLTSSLDQYNTAVESARFEQKLAADAMGIYGQQAQAVKTKLDAQKQSTDALRQALFALTSGNRDAAAAMAEFEASIDNVAKVTSDHRGSLKMVNGELDLNSEKAREADAALRDLADKAEAAAAAASQQGKSNEYVNGILERGRQQLISHAKELTGDKAAADALARSYLAVPSPTARLKGNIDDLQAKLTTAKKLLGSVPDPKKAQVRADISQLQRQLDAARNKLDSLNGKTAVTYVTTVYSSDRVVSPDGHNGPGGFPKYASGTDSAASGWALVGEQGPELVRMRGGEQVFDHRTSLRMAASMAAYPRLGTAAGDGLTSGLLGSAGGIEAASRQMAAAVVRGVRSELQIASPSKKMQALAKDVGRGMIIGLTGSKEQIKATAMDLVEDVWKAWKGQKTNVDNNLVKLINKDHAKLQTLASQRDALRARIADAQKYRADVRSQAQSQSGLSSLGLEPSQVTASSIKAGLSQKLSRLRQFTKWIGVLTKRGINRSLLRQVLAMGPEEGYAYASALVGMNTADLKAVNSLQSQIDHEADNLGKNSADALYDAGKNAGKGFLTGLQSQEKAVVDQMYKLAKSMEAAIKKALGIKSPSRVGHGIGSNFARSTGDGARAEIPYVGRAVDALAGRMAGIQPMPGRPVAGLGLPSVSAGAVGPVTINISGATDPHRTAQEVQRVMLKLKRTNGGANLGLG